MSSVQNQRSVQYTSNLNSINDVVPKIELELLTTGYNFARSDVRITSSKTRNEIVYTFGLKNDDIEPINDHTKWTKFSDFKNTLLYANAIFDYPVTKDNWAFGRCNCSDGFKLFLCHHMVGIALRLKLVEAPPEAKTIPIGQKRKRGRPAKARRALERQ